MTGQEARDDERKALIADAKDFVDSWDHRGSWTADSPVGMIARLAMALEAEMDRKHPKPEITEARVDAAARGVYADRVRVDPLPFDDIRPEERQWYRRQAHAALEAAFRVPVGEGEQ